MKYNNAFMLVVIMMFITTSLFSQEQKKTNTDVKIDGKVFALQGRHNSYPKNSSKVKYLVIDDLTYEETLAAKKKYEDEGWTYTGMDKCENGKWTIYFTKD